jgi:Uma2 family endonuclease
VPPSERESPGFSHGEEVNSILAHIAEGQRAQTRLTLDEFLEHNPEEPPYLEYEGDGGVRRKVSSTTEHAAIAAWLSYRFHAYGEERHRPMFVYVELRTNVGGESKVPDVAIYVGHRPSENDRKQATVVADLSIVITSPGWSYADLAAKCRWYIEHDGKLAMLIDPRPATVEVWDEWSSFPTLHAAPDDTPIAELNTLLPDLNLSADALFAVLKH